MVHVCPAPVIVACKLDSVSPKLDDRTRKLPAEPPVNQLATFRAYCPVSGAAAKPALDSVHSSWARTMRPLADAGAAKAGAAARRRRLETISFFMGVPGGRSGSGG